MTTTRASDRPSDDGLSRRRLLALGGSLFGGIVLVACGSDGTSDTAASDTATGATGPATSGAATTTVPSTVASTTAATAPASATGTPATTAFTSADFADLGTCRLLPDLTQGPFPTITQLERRDITEGMDGLPLRIGIQVVDEACAPIPGATVEIWHCDIDGDYSAYADNYTDDDAGGGTTFFRGSQVANDEGIVEFHTVYPGWYRGRAVHIHSKVHIDDATVLTTQFLFDDALNDEVMATEPYAPYGEPDTTNERDGVTGGTAEEDGLLFTVADDADIAGRRALIVVGLDPTATSSNDGAMGGPPGGAPGGGPGGAPGGPPPSAAP